MPRYWWVNHKQTFRQEIDGAYLWSPKRNAKDTFSQYYANMRAATPGDLVLSYASGLIRHVGRVAEFCFTAPKPEEFGATGDNWSSLGWLLPVFWVELAEPVRPRNLITRIGPLLPDKYSPINPVTGNGYQVAYLSEVSQAVFETLVGAVNEGTVAYDRSALARGGANRLSYRVAAEELDDAIERQVKADTALDDTTRHAVIEARRGQGRFRNTIHAREKACRLTGITNPALLIASHIKPWRLCNSAAERLDGDNGLMLTPDADLLFDRGFVTFDDDGSVRVSDRFDRRDLERLGLGGVVPEQFGVVPERFGFAEAQTPYMHQGFRPKQRDYLAYHRAEVFVA